MHCKETYIYIYMLTETFILDAIKRDLSFNSPSFRSMWLSSVSFKHIFDVLLYLLPIKLNYNVF